MFQHSNIRHSHNKGSKIKRVLQIGLLLVVVIWLLNHINKKESVGGDHINFDLDEDVDLGRKAKAGSENVVFIDSHMGNVDETPETSEASEQDETSGQHTEEENDGESFSKEKEDSQVVSSNPDQTEIQEEKLGANDNDDSNVDSTDASGDITNEKEDALQLPSQNDSENSLDQNEGRNTEDNSVQQNELETLVGVKKDIGEETTSEKERILGSNDQSEVGDKTDETEKEAIDSHEEVKLESENSSGVERESTDPLREDQFETEGSRDNNPEVEKESTDSLGEEKLEIEGTGENSSEVENEATDSHGGVESEIEGKDEDKSVETTTETHLDNADRSLPGKENELSISDESSEKNTLESGDIGTNDPTEHHRLETIDTKTEDEPINVSTSTEEKESSLASSNEVPKREVVVLQENSSVNEATNDNLVQVEESKTKSESKLTVTPVVDETRNEELPVINEALERDAIESHDVSTSDGGKNDVKEESVGSNPNEDALESKGDAPSEDQNMDSVTENFSHSDEDKPKVEVDKYQADGISREVNNGTSELTVKEQTPSELDNGSTSSAGTDDAASSNHGGKETE